MRAAHPVLMTCLLLAVAGCGRESAEAEVARSYNALVEALEQKDYEEACERLTDRTRQDLRNAATIQGTEGCGPTLAEVVADVGVDEQALKEVTASDVEVVDERTARVNDLEMSREGEEWLLEGDLDFVRPLLSGGSAPR